MPGMRDGLHEILPRTISFHTIIIPHLFPGIYREALRYVFQFAVGGLSRHCQPPDVSTGASRLRGNRVSGHFRPGSSSTTERASRFIADQKQMIPLEKKGLTLHGRRALQFRWLPSSGARHADPDPRDW